MAQSGMPGCIRSRKKRRIFRIRFNDDMDVIAAGRPLDTTPLSAILVLQLITMDCNQTMSNAYQKMRDNNIRHLSISREIKSLEYFPSRISRTITTSSFAKAKTRKTKSATICMRNLKRFLNQPPYIKPHGS